MFLRGGLIKTGHHPWSEVINQLALCIADGLKAFGHFSFLDTPPLGNVGLGFLLFTLDLESISA